MKILLGMVRLERLALASRTNIQVGRVCNKMSQWLLLDLRMFLLGKGLWLEMYFLQDTNNLRDMDRKDLMLILLE